MPGALEAFQKELDTLSFQLKGTPEGSPEAKAIEIRMDEIRNFLMVA